MQIILRLIIFLISFTTLFLLFRNFQLIPMALLHQNLSGISWLYSAICLIFSIVSAFIIQTQWNRWDRLETALKGEINSTWELLLFSEQLPVQIGKEIKQAIKKYLAAMVSEGWQNIDNGERSESVERTLRELQRKIVILLKQAPEDSDMATSMFLGILDNRNDRLHYSTGHLPFVLYILIWVASAMVIFLSLFIAVENFWLDYLFTTSIATLAFLMFSVIEDLNHPFRPGTWHLTPHVYNELLEKIKE